jgi:dihydrofolate reductase
MNISLLVAASENNVIGKDNGMLWSLPNDLAYFKNLTWGFPMIMGRKTFDSLSKALRGRTNIVITRNPNPPLMPDVLYASSLEEALDKAAETDALECYVIGGGQIFSEAISIANRIYMTRVLSTFNGDAYFPAISPEEWTCVSVLPFEPDEKHAYPYRFEVWERKDKPTA